jgi:hypothetical protein
MARYRLACGSFYIARRAAALRDRTNVHGVPAPTSSWASDPVRVAILRSLHESRHRKLAASFYVLQALWCLPFGSSKAAVYVLLAMIIAAVAVWIFWLTKPVRNCGCIPAWRDLRAAADDSTPAPHDDVRSISSASHSRSDIWRPAHSVLPSSTRWSPE